MITLKNFLSILALLAMTGSVFAQSLVETVDFGPMSATGTNIAVPEYTSADVAQYGPLTSVYVYITGTLSGTGTFIGNGGTPSITVNESLSSNTFSTPINLTLTGGYTDSSSLASGDTESFSFTGMTLTGSAVITQNLANYTGNGTFNVNIDAGTPQVSISGASGVTYPSGLNANSAYPISGSIIISYNYPYSPVPEPRTWMALSLAWVGCLWAMRKVWARRGESIMLTALGAPRRFGFLL